MPIHNSDIADVFFRIADLLEIKGDNPFRIRAYRNAARTVIGLPKSAAQMLIDGDDLTQYPGLGEAIIEKIRKIVNKEQISILQDLEKEIPAGLSDLLNVAGLGGKRVHVLYKELHIDGIETLKSAAEKQKIRSLPGFGEKTESRILEELGRLKTSQQRIMLAIAEEISNSLIDYLKNVKGLKNIITAGSFRRRRDTVGDLDILVTEAKKSDVMEKFTAFDEVAKVIAKGETKSSVVLNSGMQVDLRSVPEESYGAALLYFTGSKEHSIELRKIAQSQNLKINEYGIFKGHERIAGLTEVEMYKTLGLKYIEPELRENRGEIQLAQKGKLPRLIKLTDIKGDLHTHTNYSDGHNTIKEMAQAAQKRGYEYIAISDHSKRLAIAHGLDSQRLKEQFKEIDALNKEIKGIEILKSMEVDIIYDGSLDLADDMLKQLDIVIGAIHSKFNLSQDKQTERLIKAMSNPFLNIIAHPTGRLCGKREPYDIDMQKIMKEAKKRNCILEINSHPERLDINDNYCRLAKDIGVNIAISTDSHRTGELKNMAYGIDVARRGWLEAKNVVNTRPLKEFKGLLKK